MNKLSVEHATLQLFDGTVPNIVNQFLTERSSRGLSKNSVWFYTRYLRTFCDFLNRMGVIDIEEVTPDIVRKYLLYLEGQGHNPGGVHGHYRCVRALLNWWEEETDGDYRSPMHKVKAPKVILHPLPGVAIDDVKKLVGSCSTSQAIRDRAILLVLLDTGARASEFLALDMRNIDLITGAVRIEHGKGDKSRTVYLGSTSRKAIRRYLKSRGELRPGTPLWVTDEGERLKFSGLRQIIERCACRAGIATPGLHDFRRSFALTMLRNGIDLQTISRLLGHSSLSVTERYLAQEQADLADGHRRGSPVDNAGF